ncbi:MAG: hypothetical protein ABJA67_02950 [Chthonomonadales bacterium]
MDPNHKTSKRRKLATIAVAVLVALVYARSRGCSASILDKDEYGFCACPVSIVGCGRQSSKTMFQYFQVDIGVIVFRFK